MTYLKLAFRNLKKNKVFSIINILGLSLGLASFVFIIEYISHEKSVNGFHENKETIYRVVNKDVNQNTWPEVAPGWAQIFKEGAPEVASFCRIESGIGAGIVQNKENQLSFKESDIGYVEGNFFDFFSFDLLEGNTKDFNAPFTTYISKSAATKYFGNESPINKSLYLYNQFGNKQYEVKGVYEDMGQNSDIQYDMVFSFETLKNTANLNGNGWANLDNTDSQYAELFFNLNPNTNVSSFEDNINKIREEKSRENDGVVFKLQSIKNLHLGQSLTDDLPTTGNLFYIYILSGVALLILLIAWFNYINLSTSSSLKRASEVGIRKAIGATRTQISTQFLAETMLVNFFGFVGAIALVGALQHSFNNLVGKELSLLSLHNSSVLWQGISCILLGSILTGIYTSLVLSRFNPIQTLKGRLGKNNSGNSIRKVLVVSQFGISILLIVSTLVIFKQLNFMRSAHLGFNQEQMIVVNGPQVGMDSLASSKTEAFSNFLNSQSFVINHAASGNIPGYYYNFKTVGFTQPNSKPDDKYSSYAFLIIDEQFLPTYEIPIVGGRNFTYNESDVEWNDNSKVMINEKSLEQMGFTSIEEALDQGIQWDERHLDIIGITADYHHTDLRSDIDPIIYYPQKNNGYFSIRLSTGELASKLSTIEQNFKEIFPGNPYEFRFTDEIFAQAYETEDQYGKVFTASSMLAIFIACLGLFGLATFVVETRVKEIGIRKVLGASITNIVNMLSLDFVKLVFIALIVFIPIAWYAMNLWMKDFAYQADINWVQLSLIVGAGVIGIAMITVGFLAFKSAVENPVKSLRTE